MNDLAVAATGLSKAYRVYARPADRLREMVLRRPRHRLFHALADVSFELPRGEGLGVVGENGAGKSTLLKILAGITAPSAGRVEVRGKVASILELGSAFHPELTGRQNIVLNAAMLGLSEAEVRERTPEIIAFSELGEFIDQPVKCYSTGMAVRLGFSIATQVDPEVLIIDEALSVGDGYFQKKCMDRLLQFISSGRTLLFCSHAMYYVSAFCRRALWLRQGRVAALGATAEVVHDYENYLLRKRERPGEELALAEAARPGPARLLSARLLGGEGEPRRYRHGQPWALEVVWETSDSTLPFHLGVGINRVDGVEVCAFATRDDGLAPFRDARLHRAELELGELPLVKGEFTVYVFLLDGEGLHVYDQEILARAFAVESPAYTFGLVRAPHAWRAGERESAAAMAGRRG